MVAQVHVKAGDKATLYIKTTFKNIIKLLCIMFKNFLVHLIQNFFLRVSTLYLLAK